MGEEKVALQAVTSEVPLMTGSGEVLTEDIQKMIELVGRLQHIKTSQLVVPILKEFEALLDEGVVGSAMGIYEMSTSSSEYPARSISRETLPRFGSDPCPVSGKVSREPDGHYGVIFYENQTGNHYCYFYIRRTLGFISNREKEILNFMLPHLYSSAGRLYLISQRLLEYDLTVREQEVMQWIIEGKDNWSISKILGVSERTVKFHNCNICKKLGVNTKTDVIRHYHSVISSLNKLQVDSTDFLAS